MPRSTSFRIRSDATGTLRAAQVVVYPSREAMVDGAHRFNGFRDEGDTLGVTQAYRDDAGFITEPVIRLHRQGLGLTILAHEVSHAATAIYGSTGITEPLDHGNEPLAHLHSDLLADLVVGLRRRRLID